VTATVTRFPLSKHTGEGGATPAFSSHRWKVGLSPSPVVARWVLPLLPSPAGLFIYSSVRDCPSPLFGAQCPPPSFLHVFFVVVYYSGFFSLFSLGRGQSVQGAILIWPRVVCGSTMCCLAHVVVCFSQAGQELASGDAGALLVSPFNIEWDAVQGLGVWRCQSFASSWWFFLQGISTACLQDFTLGSMLSASSL
jgi:hypothetical protein